MSISLGDLQTFCAEGMPDGAQPHSVSVRGVWRCYTWRGLLCDAVDAETCCRRHVADQYLLFCSAILPQRFHLMEVSESANRDTLVKEVTVVFEELHRELVVSLAWEAHSRIVRKCYWSLLHRIQVSERRNRISLFYSTSLALCCLHESSTRTRIVLAKTWQLSLLRVAVFRMLNATVSRCRANLVLNEAIERTRTIQSYSTCINELRQRCACVGTKNCSS